MIITNSTNLASFSKYPNLRLGSFYELPKSKYPLIPFTSIISHMESGSRPVGGIKPQDYGQAISLGGEQIGANGSLVYDKLPYVSNDYYESSKKGKVVNQDILICKDGALTGKVCLVDLDLLPTSKVMVNEHVYVVRGNEKTKQLFLFYLLRTKLFRNQVHDLAYRKKGQPGLNQDHIKALKVPDIPKESQLAFIANVQPLTDEIKRLEQVVVPVDSIIDTVFIREFSFDYFRFEELKAQKNNRFSFSQFSNNADLRFSAKYHRVAKDYVLNQLSGITGKKIKHFLSEPIALGTSVSPNDYSKDGEYYYISMASIKRWQFDPKDANTVSKKFSDLKKEKTVKKNDIILARSGEGTIGKVALIDSEDVKGIFADFTMRIRLKEYSPEFAYYYFRTSYFQYLIEVYKKGLGNNTNIFPIVIQEFPMIDISLDEQQRIVGEIHSEIEKQESIKAKIASLRSEIDRIIEDTIIGGETA